MNTFDNLIDINQASERYHMTPQGIKQQIGKKIKENIDCKKFGNSWVFLQSSLDIIFRDKLDKGEHKQLEKTEQEMLINMGINLGKDYLNSFGIEKSREFIELLNNSIKNKNDFINLFLTATLESKSTIKGDFTYCVIDDYYPENCFIILTGLLNVINNK